MRKLTRRQRTSAIVLALTALCFITLDLGGGGLAEAHSGVRGMLGSLYRGTDSALGPVRRFVQGIPSAGTHESRIKRLEAENAALRGQLAARAADRRTTGDLARLQREADGSNHVLVPARVIAIGPGQGFDWTVTLDAGTHSGVRDDRSVTDGHGLVGRVLHADAETAVVMLAVDPGSGVGVRDERNGEIGVASGAGTDGFEFVPLNPDAVIKVGDALTTGPTGETSYVAGLSVGTVSAVRTSADGTVRATVTPTSSPTSLDLVGVVVDTTAGVALRGALTPGTGTGGR